MNLLVEVSIVLMICLLGEGVAAVLPITFPASVLSMGILLILFILKWLKPTQIETLSQFLLKNMAFFFIPAGVSIMEHYDLLQNCLIQFVIICILSTVLTFAATAYTIQGVIYLQNKKGEKHE